MYHLNVNVTHKDRLVQDIELGLDAAEIDCPADVAAANVANAAVAATLVALGSVRGLDLEAVKVVVSPPVFVDPIEWAARRANKAADAAGS